jgi:hypothetical protein
VSGRSECGFNAGFFSASTALFGTVPAGSADGLGASAACANNSCGKLAAATTAPVPAIRAMNSRRAGCATTGLPFSTLFLSGIKVSFL